MEKIKKNRIKVLKRRLKENRKQYEAGELSQKTYEIFRDDDLKEIEELEK